MRFLAKFFLFTFSATWICWAASSAISNGSAAAAPWLGVVASAVFLLGVFAPALVALALTKRNDGRTATQLLLGRIFKWNVGWRWYLFALAYMAVVKLSVAVVHRMVTGAWPRFGQTPWYLMVGAIAVSTWAQAGEEIGWRGYALPRLAKHFGLAPASIILGIIWATWHLPLFFFPGNDLLGQSFPLYLLQVTAVSVAMAWLYWRTGGSLLLVMLLHAAVNNTKDIVPSADLNATTPWALSHSLVAWLTVALLWIAAAYFLFRLRKIKILQLDS
ncbi:MAG TPA: CPBP family intramembrane glutamic endopeptidase [Pyrinomonadaceae bacterium]|nr:CPBP family intramembrane glutamic endopeptidase [Pyrinomonadaceae bacterium]